MSEESGSRQENQVFIDADDLLCVIYHGSFDEPAGMRVYNALMAAAEALKRDNKSVNVLADTRDMGRHTPGSRRSGFLIREQLPFVKMAILVSPKDPYTKKISKILSSAFAAKQIKYFSSEAWARKWLKR